jgi:hypothetical protein
LKIRPVEESNSEDVRWFKNVIVSILRNTHQKRLRL